MSETEPQTPVPKPSFLDTLGDFREKVDIAQMTTEIMAQTMDSWAQLTESEVENYRRFVKLPFGIENARELAGHVAARIHINTLDNSIMSLYALNQAYAPFIRRFKVQMRNIVDQLAAAGRVDLYPRKGTTKVFAVSKTILAEIEQKYDAQAKLSFLQGQLDRAE